MIKHLCDDPSHKAPELAQYGIEFTEESYSSFSKHYCREHFVAMLDSWKCGGMKSDTFYNVWRLK